MANKVKLHDYQELAIKNIAASVAIPREMLRDRDCVGFSKTVAHDDRTMALAQAEAMRDLSRKMNRKFSGMTDEQIQEAEFVEGVQKKVKERWGEQEAAKATQEEVES